MPAIVALFEEHEQLTLFDPGEIPWIRPKYDENGERVTQLGEPMFELDPVIAAAWNARWAGKKVRILTPDSGIAEGYCAGVGAGFLGPCVTINHGPGSSLCTDPRCVLRIREIDYFPGEESFRDEEEDGEESTEDEGDRADRGEAGAAVHHAAA